MGNAVSVATRPSWRREQTPLAPSTSFDAGRQTSAVDKKKTWTAVPENVYVTTRGALSKCLGRLARR